MQAPRTSRLVLSLIAAVTAVPLSAGSAIAAPTDDAVHASAKRAGVKAAVARNTLRITGNRRANAITLRLGRRARGVLEVDLGNNGSADFRLRRSRFTKIAVAGGAGADRIRIDESRGSFTGKERTSVSGQGGNDAFAGGRGAETFIGAKGADAFDGNGGKDTGRLGAGDDTIVSDPGDGADSVKGEAGNDRIVFNGSAVDDTLGAAAAAGRVQLTRSAPAGSVDADGVEIVDLSGLGGADTVGVGDLAGTGVRETNLLLGAGDGAADTAVVNGHARRRRPSRPPARA